MANNTKSEKIAIIGAGFTGLTAAYELAKKGFHVTIYEKESSVGGLAGSFTMQGTPLEKVYHHLFRTDTDILDIIDELGLHDELTWFPSKISVVVRNEQSITMYPFNGAGDLLKFSPLSFIDRFRAGLVTLFLQKYANWKSFTKKTALGWMQQWGGPAVSRVIWTPLLEGKFSSFADKVSMAWLWARIHIRANSRKSILDKELLAYPSKGFISIADALVAKTAALQNESPQEFLKLQTTIDKITFEKNKPVIHTKSGTETFDAVLGTIPAKVFTSLLPEGMVKPLPTIDYLGAVVMVFSSDQSLSPFYWHTITDTNAPFVVFLQHTNLVPSSWYKNKQVYYIGAYVPHSSELFTMTDDEIRKKWFAYVAKLFPQFDEKKVGDISLFRLPFAQHVVDTNYEAKIPPYVLAPNVYLANFSQIFPEDRGTNYAVREGKKIASLISHDLGTS